jgi:O-methyltransferase
MLLRIAKQLPLLLSHPIKTIQSLGICWKYRHYTMIPKSIYIKNLLIAQSVINTPGCVIECGVWRGGMTAGLADILGSERQYFLFDSFEGLPPAKDIDGEAALFWQLNTQSSEYYDNCRAEISFADQAMQMSKANNYKLVQGWFENTLPQFTPPQEIALLRLDADWFESTLICLENLSKYMAKNGVIIVDDYYQWDGCARAIHHFISKNNLTWRIHQAYDSVCVINVHNTPVELSTNYAVRA